MMKLQFQFTVKAAKDGKSNMVCLTSIRTPRDETYSIPEKYQYIGEHEELMNTEPFKKVKTTLKTRHQTRKVWITMNEHLKKCYMDEDENLLFKEYLLEEITDKLQTTLPDNERKNLKKLTEKFVIEKFTGKNANGIQWLGIFENECNRLDIQEDTEKIEILKLFLEGSSMDWYNSMLIRHTLVSEWRRWKQNFCETYADKGWTLIRYAILYRYINGSLLDYALKKERILLEMNKTIDNSTLIDLIAVGLPEFIADRINRQKLNTTSDLFNELGSLEHLIKRRITNKNNKENLEKKQQKNPCKICEKKGKMNRYHPESTCWYKVNERDGKYKNQIKFINNAEIESELLNTNPKN